MSQPPPSGGPRILVVEDELLIRMTLAEALGDEGFDVVEAETADLALPILRADRGIRLLLTDIQLPGTMNGRVLAARARETLPDLPIIFMSGRSEPVEARGATRLEVYISKPYTLEAICAAARRLTALP